MLFRILICVYEGGWYVVSFLIMSSFVFIVMVVSESAENISQLFGVEYLKLSYSSLTLFLFL
jgi:hypothetical protein